MKEVEVLKVLKDQFEKAAGIKWTPGINLNAVSTDKPVQAPVKPAPPEKKKAPAKQVGVGYSIFNFFVKLFLLEDLSIFSIQPEPKKTADSSASGLKKQTRLGLEASKEENLAEWYTQVNKSIISSRKNHPLRITPRLKIFRSLLRVN